MENHHITRMREEQADLLAKISRLTNFLNSCQGRDVPPLQLNLMRIQLSAMHTYLIALETRLDNSEDI